MASIEVRQSPRANLPPRPAHLAPPWLRRVIAPAVLLLAAPATAAVYTVGPGASCSHASLQAALDAAHANPGADSVRIVRTATWTAIQVSTQTDQDVEILGGYAACTSAAPDGKTTLSGAGGQARSVIALRGNGRYTLRRLVIRDGDQAGDDDGGGIHFVGGGIVDIADSDIIENEAEDGGGIYAEGTSTLAELIIGANVTVGFNVARRHGGGVAAQNLEMSMLAPGSVLLQNTAVSRGGGLIVASGNFPSYAYIGSSGLGGLGAVYGNQAAIGGGIAVLAGDDSGRTAEVQVFSTTPSAPVAIRGNIATQRGGAIDLQPDGWFFGDNAPAVAQLRHADLDGNSAPVGAAINLGYNAYGPAGELAIGGKVYFNVATSSALHPAAAACPFGAPCGRVRDNLTGNLTGAVVHLSEAASFNGSRLAMQDNAGGWLLYLSGEEATILNLHNSLISGNTVEHALIRDDQNNDHDIQFIALHYLTVTGNSIGANGVLSINEDMAFTRNLIDQPGKALMATDVGATGGNHEIAHVLVNQTPNPANTTYALPRFVDPERGDYTPRAGSRAVDFAPLLDLGPDLYSHTRSIDLAIRPNAFGASDVGALEREYLMPLAFNGDFDTDLRHWSSAGAGADSFWDGSQNLHGPSGSGSARVVYDIDPKDGGGPRLVGRAQCVHLPGPGLYALNGSGRVVPGSNPPLTINRARLRWELRYNDGVAGCNQGVANLNGIHNLASGTTWTRPEAAALINVPAAVWTPNTSLTIQLDVTGSSVTPPTAWFDGITLEPANDVIFADGFQP